MSMSLTLLTVGLAALGTDSPIDFNRQVRPILAGKCMACHGPDEEHREGGLRLDMREKAVAALGSGAIAIVPGDASASAMIDRVSSPDDDVRMPPAGKDERLTVAEVDVLRQWIEEGAHYAPHWSLVPPRRKPLPSIPLSWAESSIDALTLDAMVQHGLAPSGPAADAQIVRRLSLDVRGLPASIDEWRSFTQSTQPDAYERLVDRFLASPAFGERWARVWLDLARYADSAGYASDPLRRTIWRYRDWVIQALNRNMPFHQFTIEQIAGDLLSDPTQDQILATAFHRNTMTNTEGGTDDEEFRVFAVKDRAATTIQVWMGLTLGCAQCHNHKFDPITQKDFYSVYAFFNQTADTDLPSEEPTVSMPTAAMIAESTRIDSELARLRESLNANSPELAAERKEWQASLAIRSDWVTLKPSALSSESGTSLSADEDGTIHADGTLPANDVYFVEAEPDLAAPTMIRLEAIPSSDHPAGGAGRHPDGNFVLSRVAVEAAPAEGLDAPLVGKFVRIELSGKRRILSLAEVEILSEGQNVALSGTASQSSTAHDAPPRKAIDGNSDGDYNRAHSVTHTETQSDPWWEIDLGATRSIEKVVVHNRTDNNLQNRLDGAVVRLLDEQRKEVWSTVIDRGPEKSQELEVTAWRAVTLVSASADYSQPDFAVATVIESKDPTKTGWAVGPKVNEPHSAWFVFQRPIEIPGKLRLRVRLEHRYSQPRYLLGRFRLSVANDPAALRRVEVPSDVLAAIDMPMDQRTPEQSTRVDAYYRSIAPSLEPIRKQIQDVEKARPQPPMVPVMRELPTDRQRKTFLMVKGNFLVSGEEVTPSVPTAVFPMSESLPRNRLGLAQWLVDPNNPLTARVAVNRLWARLFGRGIVETEEDFGTQGALPTHPGLLDELALDFIEGEWNTKRVLRQIVTSSTYRQTSKTSPERLGLDPANIWLSRAPRPRLDAETVRDQALAAAGLLSTTMSGPSVYPFQPDGLWRAAFNGSDRQWPTSQGDDRFRRGLYTFWRRTIPYPSMSAFDAPSRETCTLRRTNTNTPLQAFVTLNDPVYVEAAQGLARRLISEGGVTPEERVRYGLSLCLGRPPQESAVRTLVLLYQSQLRDFWQDKDRALAMATDPLGPLPPDIDPAEAAAWTVVANVLLNLDGVLTKG